MSKVSSSNGLEKRPRLRFPGFDEPLAKFEIGNACEQLKETIDPRTTPTEFYAEYSMPAFDNNRKVAKVQGKDMNSARKVMSKPCVLINKLNVRKKRIWLVDHPEKNAVSSTEFVPLSSTMMSLGYLNYVALTDRFTNYMLNCSSGSSNSQKRVTPDDILDYVITAPSLLEQERIARFLETIDSKIRAQEDLIELLKKYKRGLSDKLFGENETIDGWTTVPFGEAFEILQNNTFSRDEMSTESGIAYNIHYGDVLIKYGAVVDLSKSKVPYIRSGVSLSKYAQSSYLRDGDIVIADTAEDYTVGKAVEIVGGTDAKVLSGLHTIPCRPKISFAPMYLGYFINSKKYRMQILPLVQGTKVSSISKSEILKTAIAFPSLGVQSEIASMLYALDHRIVFCQACVQELVRTKEALLQQLLI